MPATPEPGKREWPGNKTRLFYHPTKPVETPELPDTVVCANNIVIGSLTDEELACLQFVLFFPLTLNYWPFSTPTLEEVYSVYNKLMGDY